MKDQWMMSGFVLGVDADFDLDDIWEPTAELKDCLLLSRASQKHRAWTTSEMI